MTAPAYWNTAYLRQIHTVTDVADLCDKIEQLLTADLPVDERWVKLSDFVFESPADPAGAKLKISIDDGLGPSGATERSRFATLQGASQLSHSVVRFTNGAANNIYLYAGKFHFAIISTVQGDVGYSSLIDTSPLPAAAHNFKVISRYPADLFGNLFWFAAACDQFWMQDSDGMQIRARCPHPNNIAGAGDVFYYETVDGQELHSFVQVARFGNYRIMGQAYQVAFVDRLLADYVVVELPIDQGVNGKFQVFPTMVRSGDVRMAIRVPDDVDLG